MKDLKEAYKTIEADHFAPAMEISFIDGGSRQTFRYEKVTWNIGGEEKGLRYGENPGQEAALYRLVNGNLVLGDVEMLQAGHYLASVPELRARKPQNAVAGAIGEELPRDMVCAVFVAVPASHRDDAAALGFNLCDGRIQQQRQVLLLNGEGVHLVVPARVAHQWVPIDVVELQLFQKPRFLSALAVGAADAHADFT